jgi:hypothetical protein
LRADENGRKINKSKKGRVEIMSERKGISPEIIAALIGVAGTIIVAVFLNQPQSSSDPTTPVPIVITSTTMPTAVSTDTVPPGEPTSTPVPTDTPAPTPTEIQPVPIGQDWVSGCISSLWQPYPSDILAVGKGNGCLQEPVYIFSADNGSMFFLYERNGNGAEETFGLFAPLSESGEISFKVRLNDLRNVDLWMGIFPEADINSDGLLLTIPSGNPKNRVIVQKNAITYETFQTTKNLNQGDGFSITLAFNALSARGSVNPNVFVTNPVSIPSSTKWLFLGYKGLTGSYRVEGEFVEFILDE